MIYLVNLVFSQPAWARTGARVGMSGALLDTLWGYVGPAGLFAATIGSFYGVSSALEENISKPALADFARYLGSPAIERSVARFPAGTTKLFVRVFGERHFSLKCAGRSVLFSIGSLLAVFCITWVHYPDLPKQVGIIGTSAPLGFLNRMQFFVGAVWVFVSLFPDYLNLLKARFLLRFFDRHRSIGSLRLVGFLIADVLLSITTFVIFMSFAEAFLGALNVALGDQGRWGHGSVWLKFTASYVDYLSAFFEEPMTYLSPSSETVFPIAFWAGLVPSIWIWAWVEAIFAARLVIRGRNLLKLGRYTLDLQKHPVRIVGTLAGLILCLGYGVWRIGLSLANWVS